MRRRQWAAVAMAAVFTLSAIYSAQSQDKGKLAVSPAQQETAAKKARTLNIRYATFKHNASSDVSDFTNAVFTDLDEGTIFRADKMKVDNKKGAQSADAAGNLSVTDRQADVTGEKAVIYYAKSRRVVVLTGNVIIQLKPKSEQKDPTAGQVGPMPVALQNGSARVDPAEEDDESAGSSRRHPATITCDKVEYAYGRDKKHALLTGNFKVVQKLPDHTRTLYAERAEYFGLEDRVLLHAPVRWEDTKNNQKGRSDENVTVFTKDDDERIEMKAGEVTLDVPDEDEEEPTPPAGQGGQKPPAGNPAPKPGEQPAPPKPGPDKNSR